MNPEDKKEDKEKTNSEPKQENNQGGKLQRKLKFKTLDGKIQNLECDYDIKISELKKKLAEIYKIEPIRQRLLNKGKQFKDDEYLDKLVDKDDTIIHLVFRSEEDVRRMQETAQNRNNNTTNQNQNNQNVNPFQNILSIVNSDQIRNLTNNIVSQFLNPTNTNNNNSSNSNNQNQTQTINIGNTQFQTLNVGEALNLTNSPLHPIAQPPNLNNPPPLNLNDTNNTNNQNANNNATINETNKNNYSSQFPITPSNTDKKYEMHLKNIEKELNLADEIVSKKIEPRIPLPLLNTTQNVFTAMSRSLRKYVIVNQNILCHLLHLADIMEREQFITNSETRMTGNKLLDQAYKALLHISKASKDLSNVIKSSNFNTAPNTGYIGIICSEIGMQTTSIPIEVGEINTENILASLGAHTNNNAGSNNNTGNILIRNINNSNNGNQGQGNIEGISAEIPINIVEVTVDPGNINNNTNTNLNNNNQTTSSTPNTNNNVNIQNTAQKENNKEKKAEESKPSNEQKEKEKEKEKENILRAKNDKKENISQNVNNNNLNNNNTQNTQNTQNNNQGLGGNNNLNNLFGNMMSQFMTPENLNSMAGVVGSMLNNNGQNQSGQGGNQNMGGIFGNLISNLMGSFGDESDEEQENNEQPKQQTETQEKKEFTTPKENQTQNNDSNEKEEKDNKDKKDANNDKITLIKKLVESPQLRRETKINDESKIGEKMEPNIEFAPVSNDIISNLTVQDIFNMYNLYFTGLSRLRKDIQKKYFSDKSKNDEIIKNVIELLCERFILAENQIDKLIQDKEFNMEEFFNKHLKEILYMFSDDNEVNKTDTDWENKFRKLVINMFINLINEVKDVYESGEDGAKTFIEFNILTLIENFIGQKYLALIQSYDEDIINKFVENLFTLIKSQEIKNKCNNEKDNQNAETPSLLTIDEIFKIATKDKDRLEKEDKEKNEADKKKKYSDFYYLTSLFKN